MPFAIYPFSKGVETRHIGPFLENRYDRQGVYDINVAHMAVDQLPHYFSELQNHVMSSRYNILHTYWGLAEAPLAWRPLLERVDELGAELLRRKRVPANFRSKNQSNSGLRQSQS
jgi:hypothetical protein